MESCPVGISQLWADQPGYTDTTALLAASARSVTCAHCVFVEQGAEHGSEARSSGITSNASWATQKQHLGSSSITSQTFISSSLK